MPFGPLAAVPMTIAVWPSAEIELPGLGAITARTAGSAARVRSTWETVRSKPGSPAARLSEWTATCSA